MLAVKPPEGLLVQGCSRRHRKEKPEECNFGRACSYAPRCSILCLLWKPASELIVPVDRKHQKQISGHPDHMYLRARTSDKGTSGFWEYLCLSTVRPYIKAQLMRTAHRRNPRQALTNLLDTPRVKTNLVEAGGELSRGVCVSGQYKDSGQLCSDSCVLDFCKKSPSRCY